LAVGVYVNVPVAASKLVSVPCAGPLKMAKVGVSLSASVAVSVPLVAVFSLVLA